MRRLRLLLDANVLVDAQLRDIFLTFADLERIEIYWSEMILVEVRRALVQQLQLDMAAVDSLIQQFRRAFPHAAVSGFESRIQLLELPDVDDRHVLAAAEHVECDYLVTQNLRDFPQDQVADPDLLISSPDDALLEVVGSNGAYLETAFSLILGRLRHPPISAETYLGRLSERAPLSAMLIGRALTVPSYVQLWDDYVASSDSRSPQYAVKRLLAALNDSDEDLLPQMVSAELAEALTQGGRSLAEELREGLATVLDSTDWGLATTPRVYAPEIEVVQLVFGTPIDGVQVFNQPTTLMGHRFVMKQVADTWVLDGLNPPDV